MDPIHPGASVLSFRGVTKRFGHRVAVEDVDLDLLEGRTLGIVGESGSGKTTCVRLALGLERPTRGTIAFRGRLYPKTRRRLADIRRHIGFVFQDPYDSLDARMVIGDIVAEPLRIHGMGKVEAEHRAEKVLDAVGLPNVPLDAYPARFSGGGRQRIAIARALSLDPQVLLCDEPTASLDVSVQAQIVNLLLELKATRRLSMIFVSHDLDLVRRIADDVKVMYQGRVVEAGDADSVHARPRHPTRPRSCRPFPAVIHGTVNSRVSLRRRPCSKRPIASAVRSRRGAPGSRNSAGARFRCSARLERGLRSPVSTHSRARRLPMYVEEFFIPMPDGIQLAADLFLPDDLKSLGQIPANPRVPPVQEGRRSGGHMGPLLLHR